MSTPAAIVGALSAAELRVKFAREAVHAADTPDARAELAAAERARADALRTYRRAVHLPASWCP